MRDLAHGGEDHLRRERVDRGRVVLAVDQRVDRRIAQPFKSRIGRDVAVGVDPGGLDLPVPDVAVDVARQERRRRQQRGPHRHGEAEDRPQGRGRQPLPQYQAHGEEVDSETNRDHADEDVGAGHGADRVGARHVDRERADIHDEQPEAESREPVRGAGEKPGHAGTASEVSVSPARTARVAGAA